MGKGLPKSHETKTEDINKITKHWERESLIFQFPKLVLQKQTFLTSLNGQM